MFAPGMNNDQLLIALQTQEQAIQKMQLTIDALNVQQAQQAAAAQSVPGGRGGKGDGMWVDGDRGEGKRVVLDQKHFQRVDKFEGNPAKFKSWIFDLITAVGSVDLNLAKDLKNLLKARPKLEVNDGVFYFPGDYEVDHNKYKGELYALIVALTTGEAKCVVRGISEKGWDADGYLALCMLQSRYDANTAASLLQCVMEVVNPPALKNHQGIVKGVTEWEVRVDGLKMKHNEDLSAPIKIAVLVGMLPKEYQDMIFQQASGMSVTQDENYYKELRDKIINIAGQRVSMITPTPMDIDALNHANEMDDYGDIWNYGPPGVTWEDTFPPVGQHQYEIDSVGNFKGGGKGFTKGKGKGDGSCHNCGQFGHWSRECPSNPKGGGKGGKGFGKSWQGPGYGKGGKGYGKSWQGPGYGKGGSGKGFGYQGTCFNCGQVGHKAAECLHPRAAAQVQVAEVAGAEGQVMCGSVEVGGNGIGGDKVWWMCSVEEVSHKPPLQVGFATRNRFDCLRDEEHGEHGEHGEHREHGEHGVHEGEECQNCEAWPVVGKGGKVSKGVKGNLGKSGRHLKFKKFDLDEEVKFIGAVGDESSGGAAMGLCFQVTDVRKPLLAVKRITEKGNVVQFGPAENDNFIKNKLSGDKVLLRKKGGSYIMDVSFGDAGEDWTEITVDSAAEESVCPYEWGERFGLMRVDRKMNLVNASGGKIDHYGERKVVVRTAQTF